MLTILTTTKFKKDISNAIDSIERLDELVNILDLSDVDKSASKWLIVEDDEIKLSIDWHDTEAPYHFPDVVFSQDNLLAVIFYKLGNYQKAFEFIEEGTEIHDHFLLATYIQLGYEISYDQVAFAKNTDLHNFCIVNHYGNISSLDNPITAGQLNEMYLEAISEAKDVEWRIFTAKHYSHFLFAIDESKEAEKFVTSMLDVAVSNEALNAMNEHLATALLAQTKMPYNQEELQKIIEIQLNCVSFYEENNLNVNAGIVLIEASETANFKEDFKQSNDLINKAIRYFKIENLPEFLGEATFRKATLLYTWSKKDSPQYYKPAINTFQNALKVFKRDLYPQRFADIHHTLALIYSEIKVSEEEKPIWTAFCASSFKEALASYSKELFPYEFAMVSHNYATALMSFPPAKLHNNLNKAFDLFEGALSVRTKEAYPFERALTLLNQLELYWMLHNDSKETEQEKVREMERKASEVLSLVDENALLEAAKNHLLNLEELKTAIYQ